MAPVLNEIVHQSAAVYFSLGEAVAALGIFFLIPQFLKPIYIFRLRVLRVGRRAIYAAAGCGFICVVAAAILPHLESWLPTLLGKPLTWEVTGAIFFGFPYGLLAWVYVFPARLKKGTIIRYAQNGARHLANASEQDRIDFVDEIAANIERLITIADFDGYWNWKDKSAFYDFVHRQETQAAAYAVSFLNILSDPPFCRTLVSLSPWAAAHILGAFDEKKPEHTVGRSFVHQIVHSAIVLPESMIAREVGYRGVQ